MVITFIIYNELLLDKLSMRWGTIIPLIGGMALGNC